jgi:hypothetical protein
MAKKGVALYKEIKNTAGDVSGVLTDLKQQFNKLTNPSIEQKRKYNEEIKRVQEIANTPPQEALNSIWDHLGTFVDKYDIMAKAYIASEVNAKQVYKGDQSLARRALERLRLRYQLDSLLAEVREEMVYNAPSELGDLWTRFEKMWTQIVNEQNEALAEEMRKAQTEAWQRERTLQNLRAKAVWIGALLLVLVWFNALMVMIRTTQTYKSMFPQPFWSCLLCL